FEEAGQWFFGARGLPIKEHVGSRRAISPEITLLGFARPVGVQITNGRLIHLQIAPAQQTLSYRLVDGLEPKAQRTHPLRQHLPRQVHPVTFSKDLLLSEKRNVILVLADANVSQQSRSAIAFLNEPRRQRRDDGPRR